MGRSHAQKSSYRCEICEGKGPKWPVECHEIWHYDDVNHIQKLIGMISLCPSCHEVKHIGFAGVRGRGEQARNHLAKINGWTKTEADDYIKKQFKIWNERSKHNWTLDVSFLNKLKSLL